MRRLLANTSNLEKGCRLIEKEEMDGIDEIFSRIGEQAKRSLQPCDNKQEFARFVANNFLRHIVDIISEKYPELDIKHMDLSKNLKYLWEHDESKGVCVSHRDNNHRIITTYKQLVTLDEIPAILELSIGKFPRLTQYREKVCLLVEEQRKFPGYIIVTPEENIGSSRARSFIKAGGLVTRFYTSREGFRQDINRLIKSLGICSFYKLNMPCES